MADETKVVDAIAGPYRGQRLTVSAADAAQAIADKWAVDPFAEKPPPAKEGEEPEPPLSDEEREEIVKKAYKWQADQVTLAADDKPKKEGEHRDMSADKPGNYTTRTAPAAPASPSSGPTPTKR